jgi:TolB-like protein
VSRRRAPWAIGATLALLALGAVAMWPSWRTRPATDAPGPADKSIAVLPFESLSEDKANAYFADGIQDEILTRLAKIGSLKVISRTSTRQYATKPGNLAEIAKQLGVANILEGTVQRAGDTVRINVQLIQAQSDNHLWAEVYDRKLTDVFGVESEVAKAIADTLQAKLTGSERQALAAGSTSNPEAYDAYLRARALESGSPYDVQRQVALVYARAVELDPQFALAWAHLAMVRSYLYFNADPDGNNGPDAIRQAAGTG